MLIDPMDGYKISLLEVHYLGRILCEVDLPKAIDLLLFRLFSDNLLKILLFSKPSYWPWDGFKWSFGDSTGT